MRIGLISYFAPPQRAVASHRILRMTRCLLEAGHEVEWVTQDPQLVRNPDPTLAALIPPEVEIHGLGGWTYYGRPQAFSLVEKSAKTLIHFARKHLPMFDGHFEWTRRLRRNVPRLAVERSWDAALFCCGPHGQIAVVPALRKARADLRIFVDYRDLLSGNPWNESADPNMQRRIAARERTALTPADVLFVNSSDAARSVREVLDLPASLAVEVMRNTADYELADAVLASGPRPDLGPGVHLGFFGTIFKTRRLDTVLAALGRLPTNQLERVTLHCYCGTGFLGDEFREDVRNVGPAVAARVLQHDHVPYGEALRTMRAMHALTLINSPSADDAVFVPGKLFDYLMARRPIWFVGGPGDAAAIVAAACGDDWVMRHDQPERLDATLARLLATEEPAEIAPLDAHRPANSFAPLLGRLVD